jgi:hypothetical protein
MIINERKYGWCFRWRCGFRPRKYRGRSIAPPNLFNVTKISVEILCLFRGEKHLRRSFTKINRCLLEVGIRRKTNKRSWYNFSVLPVTPTMLSIFCPCVCLFVLVPLEPFRKLRRGKDLTVIINANLTMFKSDCLKMYSKNFR